MMRTAAIVAAATMGDGVFALPFVFAQFGWVTGLAVLAVLAVLVGAAHVVYFETLKAEGERERLLGLAQKYFGKAGFWTGFIAIVLGLLLTLVAYLILGMQFVQLAFPSVSLSAALAVFWLFTILIMFVSDRRIMSLELAGIACTSAIIVFIFVTAWPAVTFGGIPAVNIQGPAAVFVPFSVMLFALAGWTSVEPAYESRKRAGGGQRAFRGVWFPLVLGTFFVAALYVLFAAGIVGSASMITQNTVSGLVNWPLWKKEIVAIFGLLAVATVYMPISREIKNALERDLRWNKWLSRGMIVFVPLGFVALGLNTFLVVVGLVGGLFVSVQYLLIVAVGRRALALSPARKILLDLVSAVFILAAVYELWTLVVH